jgi:hypothetical protein
MTAIDPLLTLVSVPCAACGSTAETVLNDRELLGTDGTCCPPLPEKRCWFCGAETSEPYFAAGRAFCSRACAGDYAE